MKISENWWLCIHLLVATCPQIPGKCLRTQSIHKDLDLSHSNRWKIANYSRNWTLYFICESNQQLSGVVQAHQISTNVRMMNAWDYLSDCLQRWKMKYKGGKKFMMERPKIGDFVPAAASDTFPTKTKIPAGTYFFLFFFLLKAKLWSCVTVTFSPVIDAPLFVFSPTSINQRKKSSGHRVNSRQILFLFRLGPLTDRSTARKSTKLVRNACSRTDLIAKIFFVAKVRVGFKFLPLDASAAARLLLFTRLAFLL